MPSKTRSIGHLSIGHGTRVAANQNRKSLTTLLIAIPTPLPRCPGCTEPKSISTRSGLLLVAQQLRRNHVKMRK